MDLVQLNIDFERSLLDKLQQEAHGPRLGSIFNGEPPTGDELKEEGMEKSLQKKKNRQYRDDIIQTLKIFPVRSRITIEQLTGVVGRPEIFGATNSCIGSTVSFMARKGMIRKTGRMVKPQRKERHSNEVAEWEICKYN